jgi:hypothetical protein
MKRIFKKVAAGVAVYTGYIGIASATIVTDATTAITAAGSDGLTVGGAVCIAVAGLTVVGIIIGVTRKV